VSIPKKHFFSDKKQLKPIFAAKKYQKLESMIFLN